MLLQVFCFFRMLKELESTLSKPVFHVEKHSGGGGVVMEQHAKKLAIHGSSKMVVKCYIIC